MVNMRKYKKKKKNRQTNCKQKTTKNAEIVID